MEVSLSDGYAASRCRFHTQHIRPSVPWAAYLITSFCPFCSLLRLKNVQKEGRGSKSRGLLHSATRCKELHYLRFNQFHGLELVSLMLQRTRETFYRQAFFSSQLYLPSVLFYFRSFTESNEKPYHFSALHLHYYVFSKACQIKIKINDFFPF